MTAVFQRSSESPFKVAEIDRGDGDTCTAISINPLSHSSPYVSLGCVQSVLQLRLV